MVIFYKINHNGTEHKVTIDIKNPLWDDEFAAVRDEFAHRERNHQPECKELSELFDDAILTFGSLMDATTHLNLNGITYERRAIS